MSNVIPFPSRGASDDSAQSLPANEDDIGALRYSIDVYEGGCVYQYNEDEPSAGEVLEDAMLMARSAAHMHWGGVPAMAVIVVMENGGGRAWADDRLTEPEDISWIRDAVTAILDGEPQ
jgi:hypothetical protein